MKKLVALSLAAAMAASMSAVAMADPIEINFLGAQYSDKTEPYLKEVIAAFEEENPDIKVNLEIVGWDNISTRMAALVGAGQAPDIYNGGSASEYVPDGLLYNIKDVVSEELQADFYEAFLDNNRDMEDGEIYAVPYLASVRALYCNKQIFDECGLTEAPKTWAEVEEYCQIIADHYDGEVYPWGIDATTTEGQTMIAYYGWSNGGGYVDENGDWMIDDPANVEGYEWAKKLYDNGWTNENPSMETRDDMQKIFAENKMAMLVTACFFPALYPDTEMIIGEIPYNDANVDASSTLGVQDGLMIFNGDAKGGEEDSPEKIEAIKAFLDFFFQPEYYTQFMINEGLLPSTKSGAEKLAELDPKQAAYIDVLAGAKFYARYRADWKEVTVALITNEQAMFEDVMTAQEALEATMDAVP